MQLGALRGYCPEGLPGAGGGEGGVLWAGTLLGLEWHWCAALPASDCLLGWPCHPSLCGRVALEVLGASNSFPISTSFTRLSPGRLHPRTLRGLPPPYTELSPFTVQSSWQGGHMGLSWPSGRTLVQPVILPRQQCTSLTLCQVRTRSEDVT